MKQYMELNNNGFAYYRKPASHLNSVEEGTCSTEGCSNKRPAMAWVDSEGNTTKMEYTSMICYTCASQVTSQQTNTQSEELTMTNTNTTTNTTTAAEEVINNIKAGKSTNTTKGASKMTKTKEMTAATKSAIAEAASKAWAAVRGYDYKAAFNTAITKLGEAYTSTKVWLQESRTGQAITSTAKYAGYAVLAGAFISTGSIALNAALTIALGSVFVGMHNAVKAVAFDKQDLSMKDHAMNFLKAAAGMTAFVTTAWFVAPLVYAGIYYVASTAMYSVVYSFVVIFG